MFGQVWGPIWNTDSIPESLRFIKKNQKKKSADGKK